MDTLAIIGMVLSQPPPPGGNIVSQIGKAMGTGFIYNKMMDSAEQEQVAAGKKQGLEERKTRVDEKIAGIQDRRTDIQQQGADTQRMLATENINLIRQRVVGTGLENKLKQIELIRDPAERELKLRKLQAEIDNLGATADKTRAGIRQGDPKETAEIAKTLRDVGALGMDGTVDWRRASTIYSNFRYRPLAQNEVAWAKNKHLELVRGGMDPLEAERQLNDYFISKRLVPIPLTPPVRR